MSYRIGQGYDVHQLKPNLPFVIGGVKISHIQGIVAHSDGDVLIHAIIDAILGAYNLGDIGKYFPNTEKWKNVSGISMLKITKKDIIQSLPNSNQFKIVNIDTTIILQRPKLSNYIIQMKNNIGDALNLDVNHISIKATTTDGLGFVGLEKGIAATAICLIEANL